MENNMFGVSVPIMDQNPMSLDEISAHVYSGSLALSNALENNSQRHTIASHALPSTLREEAISNCHINYQDTMVNSEMRVPRNMPLACSTSGNTNMQGHTIENSLSASSSANLLSGSTSFQENIISAAVPSVSVLPSDEVRPFVSNRSCNNKLNSSLSASENCAYGTEDDVEFLDSRRYLNMCGHSFGENYDEGMGQHVLPGRKLATVRPSYHVISGSGSAWFSNKSTINSNGTYMCSMPGNELSLTLGSRQPSILNMPSIPDQISEISCSGIAQVMPEDRYLDATELQVYSHILWHSTNDVGPEMGLGLREPFTRNGDLSLNCGSSGSIHFSHMLLGSRYMHVAQQALAEVAGYALENINGLGDSSSCIARETTLSFSSSCFSEGGTSSMNSEELLHSSEETRLQDCMEFPLQRDEPKTRKTELLNMLQMIDHGYSKCMDQIQNVMSAFHATTNSGMAQMPAQFALQAISHLYKSLRERITSQILFVNQYISSESIIGKENFFEPSFIEKQWALQQLGRNDQQLWRPQRGLPEKSVFVLRTWMFQNFLHPYPKDNEKHLLAIKSGLTRSQVSNWFINARVRLWKPMIEEMYSEISEGNQTQDGAGDHRSHVDAGSQRMG